MMQSTISKISRRESLVAQGVMMFAIVAMLTTIAAACPTCTDGLAQNDPHGQSVAAGYYYSILFMMSMPYIVLGTFISAAYYSIRRAKAAALAEAGSEAEAAQATSNSGDVI